MKESLGLELYSELKQAFSDILPVVFWVMAIVSLILAILGLLKCYDTLRSTAIICVYFCICCNWDDFMV